MTRLKRRLIAQGRDSSAGANAQSRPKRAKRTRHDDLKTRFALRTLGDAFTVTRKGTPRDKEGGQ
jgi:hypothetical protein